MARPSPETAYSTVWVAPGVEGPVGLVVEGVLGSVGRGRRGWVRVRVVVGAGVVKLGSVIDGSGATTVCWRELLMITSATSPDHHQDRDARRFTASAATSAFRRRRLRRPPRRIL